MRRVAASNPADYHVLHHKRSARDICAALTGALDLNVPNLAPRLSVDSDQVVIQSPHENEVLPHCDATVPSSIPGGYSPFVSDFVAVRPKPLTRIGY